LPNLNTQSKLESDLEKFHEQEKALRLLGWFEVCGVWFPPVTDPDFMPMLFDSAIKKAGIK
jgi:hypothetical protein